MTMGAYSIGVTVNSVTDEVLGLRSSYYDEIPSLFQWGQITGTLHATYDLIESQESNGAGSGGLALDSRSRKAFVIAADGNSGMKIEVLSLRWPPEQDNFKEIHMH